MLAELAAANAAFAVIKQAVQNGRELADAGSAITKYVGAKEELSRRAKKRKNRALLIVTLKSLWRSKNSSNKKSNSEKQ